MNFTDGSITEKQITDMKMKTLYQVNMVIYIVFLVFINVAIKFSLYTREQRTIQSVVLTSILVILIISVYMNDRLIKNASHKILIYLLIFFMMMLALNFLFREKFVVISSAMTGIMTVVIFLSNKKRHLIGFFLIFVIFQLSFYSRGMVQTIEIGMGNLILQMLTLLITVFGLYKAMSIVTFFENNLVVEINNLTTTNQELSALNQQYQAVEKQLHAQYDEIRALNNASKSTIEKLNAVFNASEDGIVEYLIDRDIFDQSYKAMELLGINELSIGASDSAPREDLLSRLSEEDALRFYSIWQQLLDDRLRSHVLEVAYKRGNEDLTFRFTFVKFTSRHEKNEHILMVIRNVTNEKEQEKHIYNLAFFDGLTGLNNRVGFQQHISDYIEAGNQGFQVFIVDLDNFKYINDTFGYEVGDVLIQMVANELKELDANLYFLSRLGGDDFGFIVPEGCDIKHVLSVLDSSNHIFKYKETDFTITYSIGISEHKIGLRANDTLMNSELAMYKSKEMGKKQYCIYDTSFSKEVENKLLMSNALERAIEEDGIYLVYQPKYRTSDESIASFEALARWQSKEFGLVSPVEFIRLAEQTGYINVLGLHIAEMACQFSNRINKEGRHILISINISGVQLLNKDFLSSFKSILEKTQTDPHNIGVEVTETAFIQDIEIAEVTIKQLKAMGIKIYLDDFGTGYSSLSYLNRLPIDVMKIDKSFVDHIHEDEKSLQLIKTIISISKHYDLQTVAEGVEYESQYRLLSENGCDLIQGYYFDKPLLADVAIERMNNHEK